MPRPTGHHRRKPTIMAVIHAGFPYSSKVATSCIVGPSRFVNVIHIHIDAPPLSRGQGRIQNVIGGAWGSTAQRPLPPQKRQEYPNLLRARVRILAGNGGFPLCGSIRGASTSAVLRRSP